MLSLLVTIVMLVMLVAAVVAPFVWVVLRLERTEMISRLSANFDLGVRLEANYMDARLIADKIINDREGELRDELNEHLTRDDLSYFLTHLMMCDDRKYRSCRLRANEIGIERIERDRRKQMHTYLIEYKEKMMRTDLDWATKMRYYSERKHHVMYLDDGWTTIEWDED